MKRSRHMFHIPCTFIVALAGLVALTFGCGTSGGSTDDDVGDVAQDMTPGDGTNDVPVGDVPVGDMPMGDMPVGDMGSDTTGEIASLLACIDGVEVPASIGDVQANVSEDATYCLAFADQVLTDDPAITLPRLSALWAQKSAIRFKPGQYGLPSAVGTYDFQWPNCVVTDGVDAAPWVGDGQLAITSNQTGHWQLEFDLANGGETIDFQWQQFYLPPAPQPVLEIGSATPPTGNTEMVATWCGERLGQIPCRALHECRTIPGRDPLIERFVFDGGQVDLHIAVIGGSIAGNTDLAIITRAEGTLLDTPFVQEDYFALGHIPAHHNLGGATLVMFETPIGPHCGLMVAGVGVGLGGTPTAARAVTVDCAKTLVEELPNATGVRL